MKINILSNSTNRQCFVTNKLATVYLPMFGAEYNMPQEAYRQIWGDQKGMQIFCDWLNEKNIARIKPYQLSLDNGQILAAGFDIHDDDVSMLLLKA